MAYGAKDILIKEEQYKAMEDAYKRYGIPYTMILYPKSGHELDGDPEKSLELQNTVK